jgi:hypothetical protein
MREQVDVKVNLPTKSPFLRQRAPWHCFSLDSVSLPQDKWPYLQTSLSYPETGDAKQAEEEKFVFSGPAIVHRQFRIYVLLVEKNVP